MTMVEFPLALLAPTPDALRRLIGLRYAVAALLALAILSIRFVVDMPLPLTPALVGLAALLLINAFVHWQISKQRPVSEQELFLNFTAEVLALTGLLYFAGGSTNPLVSLYLLPLTVAANLLTRRHTWSLTLLTVIGYSLLLVWYVPFEPVAAEDSHEHPAFNLHVLGMWVIFVVSAALIAHYVSSMAQSLRERDRQLAHAREEALRNERIIALGTLGAGAAHELGTPLATMSVLAEDMARRHRHHGELANDVADMQNEIAQCKRILSALTETTGSTRGEGGGAESADRFLERTIDRWQIMRPTTRAALHWGESSPAPTLVADRTLEQALLNLLNNAADASPEGFEVSGRTDGGNVVIDILDHGPGLTTEVQARAGELFFSTKAPEGGMGIGLFLANATIERFGGSVRLFNRSGGGACTRVTLPFLADTPATEYS
jgi:two-component system sensor histidine kinase RegB